MNSVPPMWGQKQYRHCLAATVVAQRLVVGTKECVGSWQRKFNPRNAGQRVCAEVLATPYILYIAPSSNQVVAVHVHGERHPAIELLDSQFVGGCHKCRGLFAGRQR